jgi:hypothetical protein
MRRDITVIGISTWFLRPGRSQNRSQQARGQPGHLLSGHDGHYLAKVLDRFGDDKGAASARTGAARRNLSPCAIRCGRSNETDDNENTAWSAAFTTIPAAAVERVSSDEWVSLAW